jgi:hypothetical protein
MTVYKPTYIGKMSGHGAFMGWIWDCIIQEVDIATQKLIFEWKASEHYDIWSSHNLEGQTGTHNAPYDFFHLNSIDKDPSGNYLISSRYMHSLTYINGQTGDIIWIMGGKQNQFTDISDGKALSFTWQHHARWHDNYTTITLFDNGADYGHKTAKFSRGLHLSVDTQAMTVSLIQEYINPEKILSSSQGSLQVLPNDNVFIGYGYNGVWTEFTPDGNAICDVHFESASRFNTGDVQSYRMMKYKNWVGKPSTNPDLAIEGDVAYISWNGATNVVTWNLERASAAEGNDITYTEIKGVVKSGFETAIVLDGITGLLRITGVDHDGKLLGSTSIVEIVNPEDSKASTNESTNESTDESTSTVSNDETEASKANSDSAQMTETATSKHLKGGDLVPLIVMVAVLSATTVGLIIWQVVNFWRSRKVYQALKQEAEGPEEDA